MFTHPYTGRTWVRKQAYIPRELDSEGYVKPGTGYYDRGVLVCDCGAHLHMYSHWCNTCDECGREYNGSGDMLAGNWRRLANEHDATFDPDYDPAGPDLPF